MPVFIEGQRWMSDTEPELGLGTVLGTERGMVRILFPAGASLRQYAIDNAPLRRVRFRRGDRVRDQEGQPFIVEEVLEQDGVLTYQGAGQVLRETQLSDALSVNRPEDRFRHSQWDPCAVFELRRRTWLEQRRILKGGLRGFLGGRIELIPHQLSIAREVSSRLAPRVLLADEVGLGKTIEAGLILHRLLLTGRAGRILIVVPDSLQHQWFVELLRRFNLSFRLFDETRCAAIETGDPEANPFIEEQCVLCSLDFLVNEPRRATQAVAAEWDLVVVDEAHHLVWSPEDASPAYRLVEALARHVTGLLLLTGTPQQLGQTGHFARLRLLDPDRYPDLEVFLGEDAHFQEVAELAGTILDGKRLVKRDRERLLARFPEDRASLDRLLTATDTGLHSAQSDLLDDLLDRYGPGRVMFRNTRATVRGFPERRLCPAQLSKAALDSEWLDLLRREFEQDMILGGCLESDLEASAGTTAVTSKDPRVAWLHELLKRRDGEKVLLICRTRAKTEALERAMREKAGWNMGVFHEGMTLLQRDRSAAWFANPEGARLLLCSEIGSEGRNFQFARHLVLFDLPPEPGLLEQRIGRLDRIGQSSTIQIHVPYVEGSPQEWLFHWYQDGLDAFERVPTDGPEVWRRFGPRVLELAAATSVDVGAWKALIEETRAYHRICADRLARGRDRLLELSSYRPASAQALVEAVTTEDREQALDRFLIDIFDHFGIRADELGDRTYFLGAGDLVTDALPALPSEGMVVTADRAKALRREDIGFMSWDHPLVRGVIDLLLGSEQGTSALAVWPQAGSAGWLLEAIFILECLAPEPLHADRFLPPTPVRVVVDQDLQMAPVSVLEELERIHLADGPPSLARAVREDLGKGLWRMMDAAEALAREQASAVLQTSQAEMEHCLRREMERLLALRMVNPSVRPEELELLQNQWDELRRHLGEARLRLDGMRIIRTGG